MFTRTITGTILAFCATAAMAQDPVTGGGGDDAALPILSPPVDGGVETLDIRIEFDAESTGAVRWSDQIARFGTKYVRLRIAREGDPFPEGARFVILPEGGPELGIDLASLGSEGVWSPMIIGGRARLAVLSEAPLQGSVLLIDRIAREATGVTLYSAHGPNDIRLVHDHEAPEAVAASSRAVALLSFIDQTETISCTGFLVAPDIVLTNEHCVRTDAACASLTAVFGYEADGNGRLGQGPQSSCIGFDPDWSNYDADVTAIRIAPPPGDEYPPLTLPDEPVEPPSEGLFIVQHPGVVPKHVSFIDCAHHTWPVDGRASGTDFSHTCDTAKGSSGAPVFDLAGNLVGIHHFGFQEVPNDHWTENRGVRIAPITQWMAAAGVE